MEVLDSLLESFAPELERLQQAQANAEGLPKIDPEQSDIHQMLDEVLTMPGVSASQLQDPEFLETFVENMLPEQAKQSISALDLKGHPHAELLNRVLEGGAVTDQDIESLLEVEGAQQVKDLPGFEDMLEQMDEKLRATLLSLLDNDL
jgi:hypothetical protein